MRFFRSAGLAVLFLVLGLSPLRAQDVTLTSRDGTVAVAGDLLGFDGEFYRVDSEFGVLTLDGSGVLCDGPGCPDLQDFVARLTISGAASIGTVLMPALIEGFGLRQGLSLRREDRSGGVVLYQLFEGDRLAGEFTIRSSNTDDGFRDLLSEGTDLVMALREIRPAELVAAREEGLGDLDRPGRLRVLALDALVPIVWPGNPVTRISMPQLADVLSGDIRNWQALGGPDAPVAVHLRHLGSGPGQAVEDKFLTGGAVIGGDVVEHDSDSALLQAVLDDPFAIGITRSSAVGGAVGLGVGGPCGVALQASRRDAKTEDYPLTTPVFLYQPARRLPKLARDFLAYTGSPQAQHVIRRAGFTDQLPEEVPIADQGDRFANAIARAGTEVSLTDLQEMLAILRPMKRLSLSFRFAPGAVQLDAQSRSNLRLLAEALQSGLYDGREVLLAGFSDGEGDAGVNREIAGRRAQAVERALLAAMQTFDSARITLGTAAFGEAMPMACDDSDWGRTVNRRVEVWVR
ncbi:phosphate ABC transporter substrate-binding/OmpA family protein [Pseudooceanicola algae]|uniref:Uncharacterized protein n=1 Tax=Pseudooceanicola algae TaxID=1537215 RepID=A0A418SBC8_9RHOB|nr:phosphate ABC transporter substrate-binding/OmpA family protein [Pseudooceanicola algae]QPM91415.1 hypothetical protein PSAL_026680 [Pseudooceanicola algae]